MLASPVVAIAFCPRLLALRPPVPGDAAAAPTAAAGAGAEPAAAPAAQRSSDRGVPASGEQQLVQLPYRMVFALATAESVFLYDTQVRCYARNCTRVRQAAVIGSADNCEWWCCRWRCHQRKYTSRRARQCVICTSMNWFVTRVFFVNYLCCRA